MSDQQNFALSEFDFYVAPLNNPTKKGVEVLKKFIKPTGQSRDNIVKYSSKVGTIHNRFSVLAESSDDSEDSDYNSTVDEDYLRFTERFDDDDSSSSSWSDDLPSDHEDAPRKTVPERIYDYPELSDDLGHILITRLVNARICIDAYPTYIICEATPEKVLSALGESLKGDWIARIYTYKETGMSYQTRVGVVQHGGYGRPVNYICDIMSHPSELCIQYTHPLYKSMTYGTYGTSMLMSATIALGIRSTDLTCIGNRMFRVDNCKLDTRVAITIINRLHPYGWQVKGTYDKDKGLVIHLSEAPRDYSGCDDLSDYD